MRIERLHNVGRRLTLVLDRRDGARECEAVSFQHFGCNIHAPTSFAQSLHTGEWMTDKRFSCLSSILSNDVVTPHAP